MTAEVDKIYTYIEAYTNAMKLLGNPVNRIPLYRKQYAVVAKAKGKDWDGKHLGIELYIAEEQ